MDFQKKRKNVFSNYASNINWNYVYVGLCYYFICFVIEIVNIVHVKCKYNNNNNNNKYRNIRKPQNTKNHRKINNHNVLGLNVNTKVAY